MKNLEKLIVRSGVKQFDIPVANTSNWLRRGIICMALILSVFSQRAQAQCGTGYTQAFLNWDYLDFFTYTGNYSTGYLPNLAAAQTQYFTFGTQRMTFNHNYVAANFLGENTTHSGEAGSFGDLNGAAVDADVQFIGNGTITITFENEVTNLQFSIFDLDRGQRVQFNARNAANVQQAVNLATPGATIITIANNNTVLAQGTAAAGTNSANNATDAVLNVTIAGPVRSVVLVISATGTGGGEDGSYWLSHFRACSVGTFPNNYYQVSRPFTGQPAYVLHAFDKSVYAVNPATGRTKLLFTDPYIVGAAGSTNRWYVNSMGYDPYNRKLYYVFSLSSTPSANRILRSYDFNTGTIATEVADLNTIGIPTTSFAGVESGAGAFYNGSYYIGIETSNSTRNSGREIVIWRVDFNASNVPYRASQVFAIPVDNGTTLLHDWSDFVISNGILYDYDGAGSTGSAELDVYEHNLMTRSTINFTNPTYTPGQNAVDWQENIFDVYALASGTGSPINPYIAPYNKTLGTIGTQTTIFSVPAYTPAIPSLGDAAEAFRPLMDFGDAPSSYDPVALTPAVHETMANLSLGGAPDIEWLGQNSALADGDGADEDGLGAAPPLLNHAGTLTYSVSINVLNNTGANATLIGWLDYNFNGVFDPSEGVSITVPTGATAALRTLTWNNIFVPAATNVRTFLRFRLAPASDGMTTANPTGYIPNGEVEDYPVVIGIALPVSNLSFQSHKSANGLVGLTWEHESDIPVKSFLVQKSENGRDWNTIGTVVGKDHTRKQKYQFDDLSVLTTDSYYRLEMVYENSRTQFSNILRVSPAQTPSALKISPNPASSRASLTLYADNSGEAQVTLVDQTGRIVWNRTINLSKGNNAVTLDGLDKLSKGLYHAIIKTSEKTETTKLMIQR